MVKSRARQFMETFLKEDDGVAGDGSLSQASADQALDAAPQDPKPVDAQPEAAAIVEKYMPHPAKMAKFAEAMDAQCDRYLDEDDKDVYSPESDDDKKALMAAQGHIQEAHKLLKMGK